MERITKNEYFMQVAKTVSLRSTCRKKVGAVIVSPDGYIVSTGYNGAPAGVKSCMEEGFCYREKHDIPSGTMYEKCMAIHAEQNAIIQAGIERCKGATMYVFGHMDICTMCQRFIVQAKIAKVFLYPTETCVFLYDAVELAQWPKINW